jgi:hypothetical protein
VKLSIVFLCLLASTGVQGQNVTCSARVPHKVCGKAKLEFEFWESELSHPVPVLIAAPDAFKKEANNVSSIFSHSGSPRAAVADTFSRLVLVERANGNPCPVRVVVSTDQFVPKFDLGLKLIEGMNPDEVFKTAVYIGGFLSGCESSLDY